MPSQVDRSWATWRYDSRGDGHWMDSRRFRWLVGALLASVLVASSVAPLSVVTAAVGPPTPLPGHVLTGLASATRRGDVSPDQVVSLTIALRPRSPGALSAAVS
jgi:hypothetical protein